jgi:hypothetical protein
MPAVEEAEVHRTAVQMAETEGMVAGERAAVIANMFIPFRALQVPAAAVVVVRWIATIPRMQIHRQIRRVAPAAPAS